MSQAIMQRQTTKGPSAWEVTLANTKLWLKSPTPYLNALGLVAFVLFWYLTTEYFQLPYFEKLPGPVASFLGCSPYQFGIRSANVGFAGPGVIKETTGMDIPPKYHRSYRALSRGHIQGIWDRRQIRANLKQALLTMGGRNLYYR